MFLRKIALKNYLANCLRIRAMWGCINFLPVDFLSLHQVVNPKYPILTCVKKELSN